MKEIPWLIKYLQISSTGIWTAKQKKSEASPVSPPPLQIPRKRHNRSVQVHIHRNIDRDKRKNENAHLQELHTAPREHTGSSLGEAYVPGARGESGFGPAQRNLQQCHVTHRVTLRLALVGNLSSNAVDWVEAADKHS